jgi:hypothetical protein
MLCTIATTHRDQVMTAGATVSFFRPTRDLWVAQPSGQFIIERAVPLSGAEAAPYVARASNISAMFQQVKLSSSSTHSQTKCLFPKATPVGVHERVSEHVRE